MGSTVFAMSTSFGTAAVVSMGCGAVSAITGSAMAEGGMGAGDGVVLATSVGASAFVTPVMAELPLGQLAMGRSTIVEGESVVGAMAVFAVVGAASSSSSDGTSSGSAETVSKAAALV